jgi:hypothetical protein
MSVEACADLYMQEIRRKDHGIVLMHDIHDPTIDLVYHILPILEAEGYHFTTLPQVPSIKRALAAAPATPDQCESATLGYAVDPNVCVQTHGTRQWWRCVAGDWNASNAQDRACVAFHPLPPAPVTVTWASKSPTATYSLDAQSSDGSWSAPCVGADVLHQSLSTVFDGSCPSNPSRAIDMNKLKALRICWAESDNWAAGRCQETPYNGELSIQVGTP